MIKGNVDFSDAAKNHGVYLLFLDRETHDVFFVVLAVADNFLLFCSHVFDARFACDDSELHLIDRQDDVVSDASRFVLRYCPTGGHFHHKLI
jgi:hypothetical protein